MDDKLPPTVPSSDVDTSPAETLPAVSQPSTQQSSVAPSTSTLPTITSSSANLSSVGQSSAGDQQTLAGPYYDYERQIISDLKNALRQRKGVLTRYYKKAQRLLAEKATPSALKDTLSSAKCTFVEIESTVEELFKFIDPSSIEYDQRENWFLEIGTEYVKFYENFNAEIEKRERDSIPIGKPELSQCSTQTSALPSVLPNDLPASCPVSLPPPQPHALPAASSGAQSPLPLGAQSLLPSGDHSSSQLNAVPSPQPQVSFPPMSAVTQTRQSEAPFPPVIPSDHVHNVPDYRLNANALTFAPQWSAYHAPLPSEAKYASHGSSPAHGACIPSYSPCGPLPASQNAPLSTQTHFAPIGVHLPDPTLSSSKDDVTALSRAVSALYLPRAEIDKFDGNPLNYATFMSAFTARVLSQSISEADKLYYLYQLLEGDVKGLVSGAMHLPPGQGYQYAVNELYREFGSPHVVCNAYLQKFIRLQPIRNDDPGSLKDLYLLVNQCMCAMNSVEGLSVLNFPTNLQPIVSKLPAFLQNRWRDQVANLHIQGKTPRFCDLVSLLRLATIAASDPIYGKDALSVGKPGTAQLKATDSREKSFTVDVVSVPPKPLRCWFCQANHHLDDCPAFREKSVKDRKAFIQSKRLCFSCLHLGHFSKDCVRRRKCAVCSEMHPTSLHNDKPETLDVPHSSTDSAQSSSCHDPEGDDVMHAILPVRVTFQGKSVVTYAFYDNGSSASFISNKLTNELNAQGPTIALKLTTMHGVGSNECRLIKGLIVSSIDGENPITVHKAYTTREIPVGSCHVPSPTRLKKNGTLQGFADLVPALVQGVEVGLLIGSNCPMALEPLKVLPSKNGSYACLLRHGWTVHGPSGSNNISCHRTGIERVREVPVPELLSLQDPDFHDFDKYSMTDEYSQHDHLFIKSVDQGTSFQNGHYTVSLPLINDHALPNSKPMAVQRSRPLAKRFASDPEYREEYVAFMESLFSKGFAEEVHCKGIEGKTWYLPHHGVRHPQKQKLRVVFDCSAPFQGVSLNSQLLQGPNLTSSLVGVLTRFREGAICFVGDIESMFYQVHVPEGDRDLLRFLWWPGGDITKPMKEYRMTVHLFGASSSPSVCNFALRRIPEDFDCPPAVSTTIQRHFYVDDCLRATDTVMEASMLIEDLRSACSQGGFHLHKFVSNSAAVLETIPCSEMAKGIQDLDFSHDSIPSERALGMKWFIDSDEIGFDFTPKEKPMTRRGLLAVASSVYDPLGIASPLVLPAKLVLQEACRRKLDWDDVLPEDLKKKYQQWLDFLPRISDVRIPRWLAPLTSEGIGKQLHIFSDASSEAYGVVVYLRLNHFDTVQCCFLMGKSRVKPLRPSAVSIPRMELTAATLAVKMGSTLSNELTFKVDSVFYHTDSTSVLYFLSSPHKRFPVFVANRIQCILDLSSHHQWRYVPSHLNPADFASRGSMEISDSLSLWLHGPDFLKGEESTWPENPCSHDEVPVSLAVEADEEVETGSFGFSKLIAYYSDWMKLQRAVCVFLRLADILKFKTDTRGQQVRFHTKEPLMNLTSMRKSESAILKYVQSRCFQKELQDSKSSNSVSKQSPIYRLDPFIKDDILRVGGRLQFSSKHPNVAHPILLPKSHHVTHLIVRNCHEKLQHSGRNHVLSSLRERFWIVHGNAVVRKVIQSCIPCRKSRRPIEAQKMADLPAERVTESAPFTHVGVDLFGPFHIKCGRKECKRYGILFTCLSCRAIHLEVAASLETDSFLNGLRRFVARRGQVQSISCDNGTNLVGAERELYKAVRESDDKIRRLLLSSEIEWRFNPPHASHMGGVWERQIRSVRSVLSNLLKQFGSQLDDESLHTLMCEAESIVNSRPLTALSDNADDYQPLSPSQLLTLKSGSCSVPPGDFSESSLLYARKRWRRVQYLANCFWYRWKREYINHLQSRQKWNTIKRCLQVGDVILLVDDSICRSHWHLGRIVRAEQSKDDLVRSVLVKSQSSLLRRPISKCILILPVDEQT